MAHVEKRIEKKCVAVMITLSVYTVYDLVLVSFFSNF